MRPARRCNRALQVLGAAALVAVLGLPDAAAQKKGGTPPPPPPPGTIYFMSSGSYWGMKADGTGKAASIGRQPSSLLHGGVRWFLQDRTVADGSTQWFAVTQSGTAVQLTSDPTLRISGYPPVWAKDDSFFSFTALYETDSEWIGVLYIVPLDWTEGAPIADVPMDVMELHRPLWDDYWQTYGDEEATLRNHDWSPDGDEVAITRWVWGVGWVTDVAAFSADGVAVRYLTDGENPAWSPDGSRIAYNRHKFSGSHDITDIWTINPDGSSAVQLTRYVSTKNSDTGQTNPSWSPDGAFLVYTERVVSGSKTSYNIRRMTSAGGSIVSLTTDNTSSWPRWRP